MTFAKVRSIPACAGEPADVSGGFNLYAVYPRVCGGTMGEFYPCKPDIGLSPRVRGNQYQARYPT